MLEFLFEDDAAELLELGRSLRKFVEQREKDGRAEEPEFRREDFASMGQMGLSGMTVGEKFGGNDFGTLGTAATIFELARSDLGPAIYLSVHLMVSKLIAAWDDRGEHEASIRDMSSGKLLGAFCLTEAHAGSDAAALRTKADKQKDAYVLNGEKIYITSAGVADVYLTFARTGDEGPKGISAFVIPKDTPGISFGAPEKKMGCSGAPIASVVFSNCRVPLSARLNEEGIGYKIALSGLAGGRINIAGAACGLAARSIEISSAFVKERKQFGQAVADFQGIQFMLADMVTQLRAAVLVTRHASELLDRGSPRRAPSSIAKCFATDAAMKITTDGVQLLGGAGYLQDFTVERLMRDAKMLQIVEGTNQIQRALIARELLL